MQLWPEPATVLLQGVLFACSSQFDLRAVNLGLRGGNDSRGVELVELSGAAAVVLTAAKSTLWQPWRQSWDGHGVRLGEIDAMAAPR